MADAAATRLGDLIGFAPAVQDGRQFLDVCDKLEGQLDIAPEQTPRFVIVLEDAGRQFAVNAVATWSRNAGSWQERAGLLAAAHPAGRSRTHSPRWRHWNYPELGHVVRCLPIHNHPYGRLLSSP